MKHPLLLSILLTASYSMCYSEETPPPTSELTQVGIGIEVEAGDGDGYDDGPIIWVGPGIYYGIWFDNEWEYNDWHHYHYRGRHHHHGHHHDRHHGGRGHHHGGGKHGGHHHK